MRIVRFERWCSVATDRIRLKPDRKEVREELYAHMEDQYEELVAAGVPEKEAERETAEAMGDPKETAAQLEKVYRPFWGYALRIARCCLLAAALLVLLALPRYLEGFSFDSSSRDKKYHEDTRMADSSDRVVWHSEPMSRDKSDGYTFTLTEATLRHFTNNVDSSDDRVYLLLRVKVSNPWPWALECKAWREFYAVDSLGNVYPADGWARSHSQACVMGTDLHTGFCTWTWELRLNGWCSREADWLELRYDQCGRDVRLVLDLREVRES